mmetsp:Transcript_11445/g.23017  ORF Transcript_11445/g.23017 Transcript_11445/m.23017 type:complete len:117 (+) Transcript_11445:965-1315(+)
MDQVEANDKVHTAAIRGTRMVVADVAAVALGKRTDILPKSKRAMVSWYQWERMQDGEGKNDEVDNTQERETEAKKGGRRSKRISALEAVKTNKRHTLDVDRELDQLMGGCSDEDEE